MKDNKIHDIPLDHIDVSDLNVRHQGQLTDIEELKESIAKHGLLQPVTLIGDLGKPKYKLISGQRRLIAHQQLGLPTIRAVFERDLSPTEITIHSLVENMQRVELNYADTAAAITDLYKTFNRDEREVMKQTGLSLRKIRDYISIEEVATGEMKKLLSEGKVSPSDVKRAIKASAGDAAKAEQLLELLMKFSPTGTQKKRIAEYGERAPKATAAEIFEKAVAPHIEETIVVPLPNDMKEAAKLAMKKLELEAEEFAIRAIREWLHERGFLTSQQ